MTTQSVPPTGEMRWLGKVANCRECPHRDYYSAGRYECGKTFDGVDPYSSKALPEGHTAAAPIPDWCPLEIVAPDSAVSLDREAVRPEATDALAKALCLLDTFAGEGLGHTYGNGQTIDADVVCAEVAAAFDIPLEPGWYREVAILAMLPDAERKPK